MADSTAGSAIWMLITPVYEVGQKGPGGGIVFDIDRDGDEGYEVAPVDQGIAEWGCVGTDITDAEGTDTFADDYVNTVNILANCDTPDIAARLADNYSLNGFDDWTLPSKDQLNEMYLNKDLLGGFTNEFYWSSSQTGPNSAWGQRFLDGLQDGNLGKGMAYPVRAVRGF